MTPNEAIAKAAALRNKSDERYGWGDSYNGLADLREAYDTLLDAMPRWVRIELGCELPPVNEKVLVTYSAGNFGVGYRHGYGENVKLWYVHDKCVSNVTHWMPLPAGPEGEPCTRWCGSLATATG